MSHRRLFPLVILLASFCFTMAAHANDHTFRVDNMGEPEYLDPALCSDTTSSAIVINLFSGLVEFHPRTVEPIPDLAERWETSKNGLTWTFYLRPNLTWSDGSPLTASDFVYSWRRAINPLTAARGAYNFYPIRHAEAINTGKMTDLTQLGVRAISPTVLEVTLESPTPYFIKLLGYANFRPVKQSVIDAFGEKWAHPDHIVSSGPFVLTEWIPYKRITTIRNPHYWNTASIDLDKVIYYPIEDRETALKSYITSNLDTLKDLPKSKLEVLKQLPDFHLTTTYGTYYYTFNTTRPPFNDSRVRRALALTIEKENIVKHITRADQVPADNLTPPGVGGYTPPKGESFNVELANQLLDEAGYKDRTTFPEVTLLYNTLEGHKLIAQAVQQMWKRYLNINVKVLNQEWKILLKTQAAGEFDIVRASWFGDYMDPNTFLSIFLSNSGHNYGKWQSAEYDNLIRKAATTQDAEKRNDYFFQAETLLLKEAPFIPFYFYTTAQMIKPNVRGYYANALDHHPFAFVSVDTIWQSVQRIYKRMIKTP